MVAAGSCRKSTCMDDLLHSGVILALQVSSNGSSARQVQPLRLAAALLSTSSRGLQAV